MAYIAQIKPRHEVEAHRISLSPRVQIKALLREVTARRQPHDEAKQMTAYLLGNLLGRMALSYALIWLLLCLTLARLNWREAFRRTHHWSGLVASTTTFLIGVIAAQPNGAAP